MNEHRHPVWRYGPVGLEFGVTVAGCALLGVWVDRRLNWAPTATIVLTIVGFAGGLWRLLRQVKSLSDDHDRKST
ncbi:MAG: AtpZ/AtpI family protein [Planctomycetaceae bacterium]|nr:AtpZ/AtpI family protein [Planctomycetaceae bacterium]